jgi:hypothetical protein
MLRNTLNRWIILAQRLAQFAFDGKRQGKHPLDFFQTLFTCDTATAQNALYKNSS